MKFLSIVLPVLTGAVLVTAQASVCPTVTKTQLANQCTKRCGSSDCTFFSTIQNPCGCPANVPTATLIAPCGVDCPYAGCQAEFATLNQPCPVLPTSTSTSSTSSRRRPGRPTRSTSTSTTTSTSTSTSKTVVTTSIVTLPPKTTPPPAAICPTITRTTQPAGCSAIRCPVPTCLVNSQLSIPCGCTPKTLLYVQGCSTACPAADCLTRTQTVSAVCSA